MGSWLWSNHNIGKRESGKLREEYNELYNRHHELIEAMEKLRDYNEELKRPEVVKSMQVRMIKEWIDGIIAEQLAKG